MLTKVLTHTHKHTDNTDTETERNTDTDRHSDSHTQEELCQRCIQLSIDRIIKRILTYDNNENTKYTYI